MSKPVEKFLTLVAGFARTPYQAVILVCLVSMIAAWINWGFGLVVGALVARQVASRIKDVDFPLLIASAYSGMLIWHSGLSGSIPLKIASANKDTLGRLLNGEIIGLSETIFAWQNIAIIMALVITVPVLFICMMPNKEQRIGLKNETEKIPKIDNLALTPAEKLEHFPLVNMLIAFIGLFYLYNYFSAGKGINLNIINLCLLVAGLIFHLNPNNFLNAMKKAIGTSSGIILQFPFYAGIMGMMVQSGLAVSVSEWFVAISSKESFSVLTFLSAGIVNFFVPSGGGQWAVQAPVVIPAANQLGVPLNQAAMAVAWGDAWTNMIQPFWALPLLAIAGLNLRQIMGYCTVILIWSGLLIASMIYFLY